MPSIARKFIRFPRLLSGLLLGITLQFPLDLFGDELAASQVPQTDTQEPQPVTTDAATCLADTTNCSPDFKIRQI